MRQEGYSKTEEPLLQCEDALSFGVGGSMGSIRQYLWNVSASYLKDVRSDIKVDNEWLLKRHEESSRQFAFVYNVLSLCSTV